MAANLSILHYTSAIIPYLLVFITRYLRHKVDRRAAVASLSVELSTSVLQFSLSSLFVAIGVILSFYNVILQ